MVRGIQVLQHPGDSRLPGRGVPRLQAQDPRLDSGQVGGVPPVSPSGCARPVRRPRDGQEQDRGQVTARAPTLPGTAHVLKDPDQGLARQGGPRAR